MVLISHRKCSEKIAVELARHATPSPRTCKERNRMHHEMHPMWLPEAQWSSTKWCRLLTGLRVEARPAVDIFDKPTESSMIATWPSIAWHVLRSIGMHFSLTSARNVIRQQLRNFERGSMVLISHRNRSEKIAVELARHATPSPRSCKERNSMHHKMHPMWLPEALWSFTKCCRLTSGLEWRLDQQLVSLTSQLRVL